MGYNLNVVVVESTPLAGLAEAGWVRSGDELPAEEATLSTFDGVAGYDAGGHAVLFDPAFEIDTDALARRLGVTVVNALFGSAADVYQYRVAGPAGVRMVVLQAGDVTESVGEPLPEEQEVASGQYPEDWLFALLAARGHALVWDDRTAVRLVPAAPPPARRRGWFRRG
ncbi:hypothetical protein [Nocardioides humi]|uniref:Uncharacterized protein n=1 Tax=Nocardioides humi TaxID=449461 RepID=A0ABN2BQ92_9ACTN|nr:hypothetical protein [Nocardioides humi]